MAQALEHPARPVPAPRSAATDQQTFFAEPMYAVDAAGWPGPVDVTEEYVAAGDDGRLAVWPLDPAETRHVPDVPAGAFRTAAFALANTGNRTLHAPKRSWKIELRSDGPDRRLAGMSRLNLKSMYNDPSQMREALAWRLLGAVGVPACRHTYARFVLDGRYRGLFAVVEQVDRRMLREHFGANDRGNLYKAYCGDLGCATLERRVGPDGDDGGRQYRTSGTNRTYRLMTNEDDAASTYDDLAALVRAIDGTGLPGGDGRFATDAYRDGLSAVLNVPAVLRWAAANILLGSWDNYFATPANYYLYNSGRSGDENGYATSPYFTFLPWDYDNSLGIDYFGTQWQYANLLDWPSSTVAYGRANFGGGTSHIPLVTNLLRNPGYCAYYLDCVEHLLDTEFSPSAVIALIDPDGAGGLWHRVSAGAYLESDTPYGAPFTGRQFTNDQVYAAGCRQVELRQNNAVILGVYHYVRMRYDSARDQLAAARSTYPRGSGGPVTTVPEALPGRP